MSKIVIAGVELTAAAVEWTRDVGLDQADIAHDVSTVESGDVSESRLLEKCMDGADLDRHEAIRDYVAAVVAASGIGERMAKADARG